jgi:hypothetical protein
MPLACGGGVRMHSAKWGRVALRDGLCNTLSMTNLRVVLIVLHFMLSELDTQRWVAHGSVFKRALQVDSGYFHHQGTKLAR